MNVKCCVSFWVDRYNKVALLNLKYYVITEPMRCKSGDMSPWSIVLNIQSNEQVDSYQGIRLGKAYFLIEDAPSFLFNPGFIMNVYEGPKLVGKVKLYNLSY